MSMKILGVYPFDQAAQPCHLIEVAFDSPPTSQQWSEITQKDPSKPVASWQAAYDEQPVDDDQTRWVFFFHYLDFAKPLETAFGPMELPPPELLPERFSNLDYCEP